MLSYLKGLLADVALSQLKVDFVVVVVVQVGSREFHVAPSATLWSVVIINVLPVKSKFIFVAIC